MNSKLDRDASLESTPHPTQHGRIEFLDWLRVFAFTSVLIGHIYYTDILYISTSAEFHGNLRLLFSALSDIYFGGGVGVVVFFMISGYIITLIATKSTPTDFIIRRLFRIFPLYVAVTCIKTLIEGGSVSSILPQIILVGADFINAPYVLGGVDWTLRIEIIFYLLMLLFKILGFVNIRASYLYHVLLVSTLIISYLPGPIPAPPLFPGYFIAYTPFLLLGSCVYLLECKKIGAAKFAIILSVIFTMHWRSIMLYNNYWHNASFAFYGCAIFMLAWIYRDKFRNYTAVVFLSNLSYSIYLIHNWARTIIIPKIVLIIPDEFYARYVYLVPLFVICLVLHKAIELPGITLGRTASRAISKHLAFYTSTDGVPARGAGLQ